MIKRYFFGFCLVLIPFIGACAEAGIRKGATLENVTLDQALASVKPGTVVLLGEQHGVQTVQQQQLEVMNLLRQKGFRVSVGLEFFSYPDQTYVDQYRGGVLNEADFLKQIRWGSPSFDFYRSQAQFPQLTAGERTLALNAPRALTGQIAKQGLVSLTPEQTKLLPPGFQLGRASYRDRFMKMMGNHLPNPEMAENYFAAQSVWDDTMAWRAAEFVKAHPDQVLVVVVGEFHVQYGGGLPFRMKERGLGQVLTLSQILTQGLSSDEILDEIAISEVEGPRSDFVWLAPQ